MTLISSSETSDHVSNEYDMDSVIAYLESHRSKMNQEQLNTYTKLLRFYRDLSSDSKLTTFIWYKRRDAERDLRRACKELSDFYKSIYRKIDDIE